MTLSTTVFATVRKSTDDGREWIEGASIGLLPEIAKRKSDEMDAYIPGWAHANPQVRVAMFRLTEEPQS